MSLTPLDSFESGTEQSFNITLQKLHSFFSPLYAKAKNAKCQVKQRVAESLLNYFTPWLFGF